MTYHTVFLSSLTQFCLNTPKTFCALSLTYLPKTLQCTYGDEKDGIVNLDTHLTNIVELKGDKHMLCLGDLNARIGDRQDILNDDTKYVPIVK
jgi:hypothetical protein